MTRKSATAEKLEQAGRLLHDEIGPLLSAAGLKLQLVRMDFPESAELVEDVTELLDRAIDQVRAVSRTLGGAGGERKAAAHSKIR